MAESTAAHSQGAYDDRRIGQRLRHIRKSRRMTLQVVADLAGTSIAQLSRIETGQTALDSRKLAVALANALRIAPSDLTSLPIPAPANGDTDNSVKAVRQALRVVSAGWPDGEVQTVAQLRQRFEATEQTDWRSRGEALPGLIVDLHTTLEQRREMTELLPLAVMFYTTTGVGRWLSTAGAPLDLRWQVALLARSAAQEMNDATWLGVATWGVAIELLDNSMFGLARRELDATTVPTANSQGMQLDGMLALCRSLVSAADGRSAESSAALEHAAEVAGRTGQGDAFLMGFGPVNVGLWRMAAALESGEPDEAIKVAEALNPQEHPYRERRATYWMDYGRALTRVRRRDDAARALLRAEKLYPVRVLRNPFARDTLVELVAHPPKDAALRSAIRGMAHRAGLPL
jgi:transcriptional regulator with XRE-family HTH domain